VARAILSAEAVRKQRLLESTLRLGHKIEVTGGNRAPRMELNRRTTDEDGARVTSGSDIVACARQQRERFDEFRPENGQDGARETR
jgi:hypothetical protein